MDRVAVEDAGGVRASVVDASDLTFVSFARQSRWCVAILLSMAHEFQN
jgi:hypothetical protein